MKISNTNKFASAIAEAYSTVKDKGSNLKGVSLCCEFSYVVSFGYISL